MATPVLDASSRIRRRRRSIRVGAAPTYITALALQLALSAGFGTTAWTVPQHGVVSLHRSSSDGSAWGAREHRRHVEHPGLHVTKSCKRSRVRRMMVMMTAAVDAGTEGGGGGMRQEGQGVRLSGGENESESLGEGEGDNLYSVLGLAVGASAAEVKNAYRQQALRVHPDSEGGGANRDQFEMVTAAYEVLSDPGKRSTYDQGLAMRSFVDKVKAGNWGKTLLAVANLGAVATTVGVTAGVAVAQPLAKDLAKDLARGLEDLAVKGLQPSKPVESVDALSREHQVALRAKMDAERKMEAMKRKAEEALAEASTLERTRESRLKEQGEWNATLAGTREGIAGAQQVLGDTQTRVMEASKVVDERRAKEQKAWDNFRRSKIARENFSQSFTSAQRRVSSAGEAVAGAEQRLAEALKALDNAREAFETASKEVADFEGRRSQVFGDAESAEVSLAEAKELGVAGRAALTEQQSRQAAIQADLRDKNRREVLEAARVRELGNLAEAAGARVLRLRTVAADSEAAAQREAEAIEAAAREEARLRAEALAAKAEQEAAAAAAREEKAKREREEAAKAAAEAVERARAAELAAGAAAEAAIAAAVAARQATADAMAVVEEGERQARQLATKKEKSGVERQGTEAESMPQPATLDGGRPPESEESERGTAGPDGGGGGGGGGSGGVQARERRTWTPVTMAARMRKERVD